MLRVFQEGIPMKRSRIFILLAMAPLVVLMLYLIVAVSAQAAASWTAPRLPYLDVGVSKEAPAEVFVGQTFTYTLEVYVAYGGPTDSVYLTDTLPTSVTYVSNDAGCQQAGGVVSCNLGSLYAGDHVFVHVLVTADTEGTLTNQALVYTMYDNEPGNNQDSTDTLVSPALYFTFTPLVAKH
jgi:hypothetical protein